jgi:Flp pilus assembly pilin Flp
VKFLKNRKGAALVEYALLVAGVALIGAASVSVFGHKTNDLIGTVAAVLPGAHTDDNAPLGSGHIIETNGAGGTAPSATNPIALDAAAIIANTGTNRIGGNTGLETAADDSALVLELPVAP